MKSFSKLLIASILFLSTLVSGSAGDYKVNYAVDVDEKIETGSLDSCVYNNSCLIKLKNLGLAVDLYFSPPNFYDVSLEGIDRPGCCYFIDGVKSIQIDPKKRRRLRLFEGHRRHRNEWVQNHEIGVLNLTISGLR